MSKYAKIFIFSCSMVTSFVGAYKNTENDLIKATRQNWQEYKKSDLAYNIKTCWKQKSTFDLPDCDTALVVRPMPIATSVACWGICGRGFLGASMFFVINIVSQSISLRKRSPLNKLVCSTKRGLKSAFENL